MREEIDCKTVRSRTNRSFQVYATLDAQAPAQVSSVRVCFGIDEVTNISVAQATTDLQLRAVAHAQHFVAHEMSDDGVLIEDEE